MCEYGFTENVDYAVTDNFVHNPASGPQHQQDAQLTIEMAKEICMLQRNERGKQARQYFIQLEKDWNSPEKVMARALQIADKRIKRLETENASLTVSNQIMQPKADYFDELVDRNLLTSFRETAKQFEVGKIYDTGAKDDEIRLCSNTVYHYCDNIEHVHSYYSCDPAKHNRFCEIEVLGAEVADGEKCGSNKIKIVREIVGDELKTLIGQINGNTGLFNSGDRNSGDWNSCNYSNGVFCNQEDKDIRIFNKPSGMSLQEFKRSKYYNALTSEPLELTYWDDKNKGLRHRNYKEACQIWWSKLTAENKKIIQQIPNFDPDVFLDITGIDIRGDIK